MKNKFIFLLILIITIFPIMPIMAQAQEASDSADPETAEIKEKLKERLEKNLSQNPVVDGQWFSVFGNVSVTYEDSITIEKDDGQKTLVNFDTNCQFSYYKKGVGNQNIEAASIETGWFVIAMGNKFNDNKELIAQRVSFSPAIEPTNQRLVLIGKISEIDEDVFVLSNGNQEEITIPSQYNLLIKNVNNPEIEDININDKALVIAQKDDDGLTMKTMYVQPSASNPNAEDNQVTEATAAAEASQSGEIEE